MTTSELADKIIKTPNGYTQESVEVAKGYKEIIKACHIAYHHLKEIDEIQCGLNTWDRVCNAIDELEVILK